MVSSYIQNTRPIYRPYQPPRPTLRPPGQTSTPASSTPRPSTSSRPTSTSRPSYSTPGGGVRPPTRPSSQATTPPQLRPTSTSQPRPSTSSGGGGGGSSRPAAQRPSSRYSSLLADSLFRADRVALQTTLQDTLAQILFEKQGKYRDLGTARTDWTRTRGDEAQALGANFAARGLGSSGLYRQGLDELMGEYERAASKLDALQQDIAQQYGAQGSLASIDPTGLYNEDDYTALASIYGLLGQRGTSAGQQYGAALNQARAQAAARAGQNIFSNLGF